MKGRKRVGMPELCRRAGRLGYSVIRIGLALVPALPAPAGAEAPPRALVFDLELLDTSGEPPAHDHAGRLRRTTELLRDGLTASGRYTAIGIHDAAVLTEAPASVRACNGCEFDLARKVGSDFVVTGFIHKISTLILNVQIILREVGSGAVIVAGNADIRGDNERAWRHGVEWLLRHRLVPGPAARPNAAHPNKGATP